MQEHFVGLDNYKNILTTEEFWKTLGNTAEYIVLYIPLMLAASLLVGFAVYTAGIIGFVGLVIPHVVRILFGTDHKKLIPISALLGAIFLLWSDVLCRVVLPGKEIPIGVLTALVGAPVFIYLMARKKYGFGGDD